MRNFIAVLCVSLLVNSDLGIDFPVEAFEDDRCPDNWIKFNKGTNKKYFTCYKFVRSPKKNIYGAREFCQSYQSKLMSFDASDDYMEHIFVKKYLSENDPLRKTWYLGVNLTSLGGPGGIWVADDGKRLTPSMMKEFLPGQSVTKDKRYLAYSYSHLIGDWGFLMNHGDEKLEFICEIYSENLGDMLLDAEDILTHEYGSRVKDPRFIPRGPKIIRHPEDTIFDLLKRDLFNQVSFTCTADGFPFPNYRWYKDVRRMSLEESKIELINPLNDPRITLSGGTLIISNPKEVDDRGNYFCKASNSFGSVVSSSVSLLFGFIGEFNLRRTKEVGHQYWGKAIFCDPPRYFPDVSFYWNRDFFPNFVEESERVLVSRDGNLYFSFLDRIDEGLYSCTAQSSFSDIGRHGPFFRLDVEPQTNYQQLTFANNFPKAFPNAPISGEDVKLECMAFGYPLPWYSWKKHNGELPRKSKFRSHNKVLILPQIELGDTGDYVCIAENDKMLIEASVTVSIQTKPIFTLALRDKYVTEGLNVTLVCEAFAIPDAEYSWLKNSQPILQILSTKRGERYGIQNNVLKITNVTYEDEAMYQCVATNLLGVSMSSAQLKILAIAPTFFDEEEITEFYAMESQSVIIPCRPEASPFPNFKWSKDNQVINDLKGRFNVLPTGDLQIYPVDYSDGGQYSCSATNKYNTSTATRSLKVVGKPFEREEEILKVGVGEDLTLTCSSITDSILELVYVWRINGLRVQMEEDEHQLPDLTYHQDISFPSHTIKQETNGDYFPKRDPPYMRGIDPGQLIIRSLTLEDAGLYSCEAKTPISSFTYLTELIVHGPPGSPGGVMATEVTSTSAKLLWTNGPDNGFEIQTYSVQGLMSISNEWITKFEIDVMATDTNQPFVKECYLPSKTLIPYSKYKFQVRASNSIGTGVFSPPSASVNTKLDIPFQAPQNVGGGGGKIGDLTITWDPLPREHQHAPGIYYIVFWRRFVQDTENGVALDFSRKELRDQGNIGMFVTTVKENQFYTKYEVKVQAANQVGYGPLSEPAFVYSAEKFPQVQVTGVKAYGYNATALNVTWNPVTESVANVRGKLIGFRIKYWQDGKDETNAQIRLNRGVTNHGLVVGLLPDTIYWVRVLAHNSAGSGPESEKFRERTLRYPPLTPPNGVRVSGIDPETIYVVWRGISPSAIEEPLLGYKVRVWKVWEDMTSAKDTVITLGSPLECLVSGLELGQVYKLRVLAYSKGGDGKMSSPPVLFSMGDPLSLLSGAGSLQSSYQFSLILCNFFILFKANVVYIGYVVPWSVFKYLN